MTEGGGRIGRSNIGAVADGETLASTLDLDDASRFFATALTGALLRTTRWCFFDFVWTRDFVFASAEIPKLGWLRLGADQPRTSAIARTGMYFLPISTLITDRSRSYRLAKGRVVSGLIAQSEGNNQF